ncbi:MAG TPA: deoxyribose-phosphate aldolase [Anaeromyxobacteraceae bacterium]|nr:deoxyribose-phosphate aldolase [Anaeromyxobacteraceae bacterium]
MARKGPDDVRTARDLAPFIEHTLLREDAGEADVLRTCEEARRHGFVAVCVRSGQVARAARALAGSGVAVVATVDFPEGAGSTEARAREARAAASAGAAEVDVVLGRAALKGRDHAAVLGDLAAVVEAARVPVKVILETSRLTRDEKVAACAIAQAAGAAWVKTSTGYAGSGATAEDVELLRASVGPTVGVKASGGIRTADDALRMVKAGADRIGTSSGPAIVEGRLESEG